MSILSSPARQGNGAYPEPIEVLCTDEQVRIVRRVELADLEALARWLVENHATYRGRIGYTIDGAGGAVLRCVILRGGFQWGWKYIADTLVPVVKRQERLAALPRLTPPKGFSERCTVKAAGHQIFDTRYRVESGASGKVYTVTVRPGRTPAVACNCEDGLMQARRGQEARCSHAAAVQKQRQPAA